MTNQIPPADELADIRAEIDRLETRGNELKALIIADKDNAMGTRTGNRHVAIVKDVATNRLDQKALRDMYPDIAAEHTHPVTNTRVETPAIDQETGEIVRPKRERAQC